MKAAYTRHQNLCQPAQNSLSRSDPSDSLNCDNWLYLLRRQQELEQKFVQTKEVKNKADNELAIQAALIADHKAACQLLFFANEALIIQKVCGLRERSFIALSAGAWNRSARPFK